MSLKPLLKEYECPPKIRSFRSFADVLGHSGLRPLLLVGLKRGAGGVVIIAGSWQCRPGDMAAFLAPTLQTSLIAQARSLPQCLLHPQCTLLPTWATIPKTHSAAKGFSYRIWRLNFKNRRT
eukprot:2638383-Amphidinium_carterae.1